MKRFLWILLTIVGVTAVSCGPTTSVEETSPELAPIDSNGEGLMAAPETDSGSFPRATLTPPPAGSEPIEPEDPDGYPVPQLPSPTPFPEGYVVPTSPPALNPYPEATGNLIWILKPVGEQCAETPPTPDLQTAVADMIAFGIPVAASEMASLNVCSACGCPTSAHFRLQIDAGYLDNAEALSWFIEE